MAQFFYDEQLKKWLLQFMKIFSGWQCTFGNDPQGNPILHAVPVQYGDLSRQVATVIANNSPSQLPPVPFISIYISGLEYDQKRMQDPTFQDNLTVRQRTINSETGQYENTQGQAFTVKRLMPVPYTLRFNVDIWTSNYKQKLEIMEQLGIIFNPSLELQSNPNLIDWTSLSVVYQDGLTWTSRTIPQGNSNPIDILSWKFYTPVWLSAPIKVEKLGIIQKIITSVFSGSAIEDTQNQDLLLGQRQVITPYGYKLLLVGKDLQLLPNNETFNPPNSDVQSIASVLIDSVDLTSNGFTFYTKDPCPDVAVGQWVQFAGVVDYPTVTAISYVGTKANTKTSITVDIAQTFPIGEQVDFLPKLNPATNLYWKAYLNVLGTVRPGVSMIKLQNPNLATEIAGLISYNETDDRLLTFEIMEDTLPANTLPNVDSVIDPMQKYPNTAANMNGTLPIAVDGQRYLIVNDIGTNETASLVLKTRTPVNAGATSLGINPAFDAYPFPFPPNGDPSGYIGKTIQAINPFTKQQIFATGTRITSIDQMSNSIWMVTFDKPTITDVPQTWDGQAQKTIHSINVNTSLQIGVSDAWGGLVASANDIIEYGSHDIQQTTLISYAGTNVINLYSNQGIKVGYQVTLPGEIMARTVTGFTEGGVIVDGIPFATDIAMDNVLDFTGTDWFVIFDSTGKQTIGGVNAKQVQFTTNMTTGIQYLWNNGAWVKSYEGFYQAGDWSVVI